MTSKTIRIATSLVVSAALLLGCATRSEPIRSSPSIPAATGEVSARLEPNGNSLIALEIEHLADPSRLTPPRALYLLWAQAPHGRTLLLGQIRPDKNLSVSWSGSVPFQEFRLFLTAENVSAPAQPTLPELLETGFVKVEPKSWYQF